MVLVNIQSQVGHNMNQSLMVVHEALENKYNLEKSAQFDIQRAKEMENYLKTFKLLAKKNNQARESYSGIIDKSAIISIAQSVEEKINTQSKKKSGRLFANAHFIYTGENKLAGVDDIFEYELKEMLNASLRMALDKTTKNISNYEAKTIGSQLGNIPEEALKELGLKGPEIVNKTLKGGKVVEKPQYRSAKVDVSSFKAEILADAKIKPEWRHFIEIFAGANFTLKNYAGEKYETIHLGASDERKAIISSLMSLPMQAKDAVHFYWHSKNSKNKKVPEHIIHLRFAYELTGEGLVDSKGNKLNEADFFIYNDPWSEKIYVRSTKEMVANMMKYTPSFKDPYKSHIVLLKQSFS